MSEDAVVDDLNAQSAALAWLLLMLDAGADLLLDLGDATRAVESFLRKLRAGEL